MTRQGPSSFISARSVKVSSPMQFLHVKHPMWNKGGERERERVPEREREREREREQVTSARARRAKAPPPSFPFDLSRCNSFMRKITLVVPFLHVKCHLRHAMPSCETSYVGEGGEREGGREGERERGRTGYGASRASRRVAAGEGGACRAPPPSTPFDLCRSPYRTVHFEDFAVDLVT